MLSESPSPSPGSEAQLLFDHVAEALVEGGQVDRALSALVSGLRMLRGSLPEGAWGGVCAAAREHRLARILAHDPVTRCAAGGAGSEARLADLLYHADACGAGDEADDEAGEEEVGRAITRFILASPAANAIRTRRTVVAELIDDMAAVIDRPTVLGIAAGHLREVEHSAAARGGSIGCLLALDSDRTALATASERLGAHPLAVAAPIDEGLADLAVAAVRADFIFAPSLLNRLATPAAMRLTRRLAEMLLPGGRLVLSAFAATLWEAGYVESFMARPLRLRTVSELRAIAAAAGHGLSLDVWADRRAPLLFCKIMRP